MDAFANLPAIGRVRWMARLAVVWATIILGRLIFLQIVNQQEYRDSALNQQTQLKEMQAGRGNLYDRNLRPLAMSIPVETVIVNPKLLPDPQFAAHLVAPVLNLDEKQLLDRLKTYRDANKGYMVVAKAVGIDRTIRLRSLGVDWLSFESRGIRRYPNGALASHILGGVNFSEEGSAGIELQYEDEVGGFPGYEWVTQDVRKRGFDSVVEKEPESGKGLALTIDRRIQYVADEELRRAAIENDCPSGTVVVMNPVNGDILALANYPNYDPNRAPVTPTDREARKNRAVGDPIEPGSVFKVFTIAAALETTSLTPESEVFCHNGAFTIYGRTIHEAKGGHGTLKVEDVLAKSSNIGALKIGMQIGEARFHEYLLKFGFNRVTGIDLPGESSGLVFRLNKWQPTSLGSVAMGHEVLTTPVQLARAVSVIANNGFLVRPRLALKWLSANDRLVPVAYQTQPAETPVRVLKPETAITMRKMMEHVVLAGTGRSARLDGWTSGGKTGTAQMLDKTGHYSHKYNASYMGFAPVTNPALVVLVTLNGASKFGGIIAAPVFKKITEAALRVLNVPPDNLDPLEHLPESELAAVPDLADVASTSLQAADAATRLQDAFAESQQPETANLIALGPVVPNFVSKGVRTVLEEATASGIRVTFEGSGIARAQDPQPGSRLMQGQRVKVRFER